MKKERNLDFNKGDKKRFNPFNFLFTTRCLLFGCLYKNGKCVNCGRQKPNGW